MKEKVMKTSLVFFSLYVFAVVVFSLGACTQVTSTQVAPTPTLISTLDSEDQEKPAAVEAARELLGKKLGVDPATIQVEGYEIAEWADSCLGIQIEKDETCKPIITPGFGGALVVDNKRYEFRTDQSGGTIRFLPDLAIAVRQNLAQQLNRDEKDILIGSLLMVDCRMPV